MTSAPMTNIPVAIPAGAATSPSTGRTTIAGSMPGARTVANRLLHGTPGRMRLLGLLAVIAALALGAVSANALLSSKAAVERAANNTAQVVRVQSIHVDLLRADALATNAFLVGGLESPESRAKYEQAMASVASSLSEAAAAQPADGMALGALSQEVQTYAALVEQARSNNRLGLPVGAQYLKEASAGLRSDAIPIVDEIVAANEGRAKDEFNRSNSSLQLVVGALALFTLVFVAVWLARRTHRYLNPSLSGAIIVLIVGLVVAATTIGGISAATRDVADGDYRTTVALADVRTAANDARANESLTLIARGSGTANEKAWQANDKTVTDTLADVDEGSLTQQWAAYRSNHTAIRKLDDSGNWEGAVKASTTTEAGGASDTFDTFDTSVTELRDTTSKAAVAALDGLGGSVTLYAIAIGLAALLACWLIIRGIGQRIEEYR